MMPIVVDLASVSRIAYTVSVSTELTSTVFSRGKREHAGYMLTALIAKRVHTVCYSIRQTFL